MTIIHLSSSLGGGGAEQMVLQLAKMSNPNYKTIAISISDDNTLEPKFIENNIECHFLNISSFKNNTLTEGLTKLHSIIQDFKAPVFHSHMFHGAMLGVYYNRKYSKIPIVFTLHSSTLEDFKQKMMLFLTKSFRNKDIIFSKNARKWYLKNSAIIPNGVDFKALESKTERVFRSNDIFNFLYLGRLSDEKNPLYMITASQKLIENGIKNFKFTVVGEGHLKENLLKLIDENNLHNHFEIKGFKNSIKPFLEDAHALILPSHWEGMPVAIIEAGASRLPVIATAVGSIPDFLNDGNSFISDLVDFHKAMISVIEDYPKALKKSAKLYEEMKSTFNIENVYQKHLHLYKSVLKQP